MKHLPVRPLLWALALFACDDGADAPAQPADMETRADMARDGAPMDAGAVDQRIGDAAPDATPADRGPGDATLADAMGDGAPDRALATDAATDGAVEAPDMAPVEGCVATVMVDAFEIFRFEASRPDATADSAGVDQGGVCSRPGVLPWTDVTLADARIACESIGFAVCSGVQWQAACAGPDLWPYPYGEAYGQGVCNDHVTGSGALEVTGGRAGCVGPAGIHDQNGNVWELTDDGRRRGASYRINASMFRPEAGACEASYVVPDAFFARDLGFRCCRALPPPG